MSLRVLAVLATCLVCPVLTYGQPASLESRWGVSFGIGVDGLSGGTVLDAGAGQSSGLPITVERRAFTELFDHGWRLGVDVGYGLRPRLEMIGRLSIGRVRAQREPVGKLGQTTALLAVFGDYRDTALEGGVRLHFDSGRRLRPHVSAVGGLRRVGAIHASLAASDLALLAGTPFFDASTVFSLGADGGLSYWVTDRTAIGFDVGARYQTGLSGVDDAIGPLGLAAINDNGDRWSIPFLGVLRVIF